MSRRRRTRCVYCGAKTTGRACGSHRDLIANDPLEQLDSRRTETARTGEAVSPRGEKGR
jgi:hypothetical protein